MLKRFAALFLVVLMSIDSFAAVVGDSDGAAFVTKKEFEDLKKSFADQIGRYNTSLDGKIDGAIANYLDGIKIARKFIGEFDSSTNYKFPLVMIGSSTDWTTPRSTNDYYILSRPRVRIPVLTNQGWSFNDHSTNTYQSITTWNSTTSDDILTITPGTMGNSVLYGWLYRNSWDMPGVSSVMHEISQTSDLRNINGTNYKVFDLKNYGKGYQYFDYKPVISVVRGGNAGHFGNSNSNGYAYFALIGTTNIGSWEDGIKRNPGNNPANWTESSFKSAGSGWNNMTIYNQRTSSYLGTKVKVQNIGEWNWHGSAAFEYTDKDIDSCNFVWAENGKKTTLFAMTANMPAEVKGKFALSPDWTDGLNTYVEAIDIEPSGFSLGFAYNVGNTAINQGHFLARSTAYCPPLKPVAYNGTNSTVPSFSSLPASCVRYYDSLGNVHYMDEGMFIRNFDSNCGFDMDLLFKGKSGAIKAMKLYVSNKPFGRDHQTSDNLKFKWKQGTSTGESNMASINTGTKVSIRVDDILKGEQIYLLWAPNTASDYIELSEVQKFMIEED